MKRSILIYCLLILAFMLAGCKSLTQAQMSQSTIASISHLQTDKNYPEPLNISDAFTDQDHLSYNGYNVLKLKKTVQLPDSPKPLEGTYAILKDNKKVLATFDGVYFGLGNTTDFGLFHFLGDGLQQLIVSQTIPKGGRQWVVSLSPQFHIVYDSQEYGVGREDLSVVDLDGDGTQEIVQEVTVFYGSFPEIPTGNIPLPEVIFKYDMVKRQYVPANRIFANYLLRGIEQKKASLDSKNEFVYRGRVIDIVLQYIYAGEENEGWSFYENEYKLPDKQALKARIKVILKNQPVYVYLYRNLAT